MLPRVRRPRSILLLLPLCVLATNAKASDVSATEVVSDLEANFGIHPGERRNHIKGTCAVGEFVGTPAAARLSRSPLFSGKPVPVVARFSLAGGNPAVPDTARNPRGMALEFRLPEGALQHMTMLSTPVFGASSPQSFRDMLVATRPDPATRAPDPERLRAYRATHPDSLAQARFLESHNAPASYAATSYYGIHTFTFVGKDDATTMVRWQFTPQDGERWLSDAETKTIGGNFLEPELIARTRKAPTRWTMEVSIGEVGDPVDDPTEAWPATRRKIVAGTLSITGAMAQKGAECERINFDPLVMTDGIAPSNDPVLRFRSPAYATSFAKRFSGQ